jgi:hypothetical protein
LNIQTSVSTEDLYDLTNKDPHKSLYLSYIIQALLDLTKPELKEEDSHITSIEIKLMHGSFSVGVPVKTLKQYVIMLDYLHTKVRTFAYEVIKSGDVDQMSEENFNLTLIHLTFR